jgi:O-antigen/teichoic acid export membrane protein
MRKLEKIQILKNISSSWFSLGVNILMGIFLSPFILHRLGDTAFGIWVLIFSVTGYYGIFDFGIRSSIIRYVSKYTATRDVEEVSRLINSAMFTYTGVGALSMLVTLLGCAYIDRLFHIQPGFQSTARWLLFLAGGSVALGFPLGVFGGMLEGLQKFYILNWTNIVSTLLRVLLIVIFLNRGYGLLTAAAITVALPLVASVIRAIIALRALPITFSWKYVDRKAFRQMANYSGITFMIIVGSRLRFKTDALVIGTFLSSAAITYFYAGSRLVDYAGEVVSSLAQIFAPMSSQSDAAGNTDRLRKIFVAGNRACAFTTFPITAVFVILGKSIIEVWVGQKYVAQGYPVLLILIIPYTVMLIQSASGRVLYGMSKHGKLAIASLIEGVSNLLLSILLVRPYGIFGDALGTAIPLAGTYLLFMPFHLCSLLGVRVWTFLRQAYLLPLMLCTPLVVVLLLMQRWFVPHTYRQLALHVLAGGLVYGACMAWGYVSNKAFHVGELVPSTDKLIVEMSSIRPAVESYEEEI